MQGLSHDTPKASVVLLPGVIYYKPVNFIIDSGAERSVIPFDLVPSAIILPCDVRLSGVGGNKLDTFGHCYAEVGVKNLRRNFRINFIVTKTRPILGADFLTAYNLSLNMKQRQLSDSLTDLKASLLSGSFEHSTVCITSSENSSSFIKTNYPDLISAPDYSSMPLDGETKHVIETDCSPIYSKPRPLNPTKYNIAKREFDALLSMNIIRPSNSPWASPLHIVKNPMARGYPAGLPKIKCWHCCMQICNTTP